MPSESSRLEQPILYELDERLPHTITFALGFQAAMLTIAPVVLIPVIVVRAAGESEIYLSWAVFGALVVCGLTTVIQVGRVWRIGAGYILLMGTSPAFIAVCVTALADGGPAMLATLVVISSLFQFAFSARLSLLRRIITPTVAGTVIMLISVTVMPIVFDMLTDVPEGTPLLPRLLLPVQPCSSSWCSCFGFRACGVFGCSSSGLSRGALRLRSLACTTSRALLTRRGLAFPKAAVGRALTSALALFSGRSCPPSFL